MKREMRQRSYARRSIAAALLLTTCATGCGSAYTVLDPSTLTVSDNSRVSARNLVPNAGKYPSVVEALALAEELYLKQLHLLKERRNKLRSRRRYVNLGSYATFATATLGVGGMAIASDDADAQDNLKSGGYVALGGLAIGTMLQITQYMQEPPESIDDKVNHLQSLYDTMIRDLGEISLSPRIEGAPDDLERRMGQVILHFRSQALLINVKG